MDQNYSSKLYSKRKANDWAGKFIISGKTQKSPQKKSLDKLIIHRNLSKINHNCTDYWICLVYIYNTLILRCFYFI